ncbi:MAG: hypothetical protein ACJ8DI_03845 [Ktedonobacteraceae bacterium]
MMNASTVPTTRAILAARSNVSRSRLARGRHPAPPGMGQGMIA